MTNYEYKNFIIIEDDYSYKATTKDNYDSLYTDERQVYKFQKSNGFTTIDDVVSYLTKYFNLNEGDNA